MSPPNELPHSIIVIQKDRIRRRRLPLKAEAPIVLQIFLLSEISSFHSWVVISK